MGYASAAQRKADLIPVAFVNLCILSPKEKQKLNAEEVVKNEKKKGKKRKKRKTKKKK